MYLFKFLTINILKSNFAYFSDIILCGCLKSNYSIVKMTNLTKIIKVFNNTEYYTVVNDIF